MLICVGRNVGGKGGGWGTKTSRGTTNTARQDAAQTVTATADDDDDDNNGDNTPRYYRKSGLHTIN